MVGWDIHSYVNDFKTMLMDFALSIMPTDTIGITPTYYCLTSCNHGIQIFITLGTEISIVYT